MKTKLFTLLLFFFTFQLNAQFHFKVSMDETGLYSVKFKSDVVLNPENIVGVGQISLVTPTGGFKIGDITSVNGIWNNHVDSIINDFYGVSFGKDYFFIGLKDGSGIAPNGLKVGEEITLITFRNIGVCTGALELITATDQSVILLDSISLSNPNASYNNIQNDLGLYDSLAGKIYHFSDTYDTGQAICELNNNNPLLEEVLSLEVKKPTDKRYVFKWTALPNVEYYELKIRKKGEVNWVKRIITSTPNAYLYSPKVKEFEYQVIAHQKKKIFKSKITTE